MSNELNKLNNKTWKATGKSILLKKVEPIKTEALSRDENGLIDITSEAKRKENQTYTVISIAKSLVDEEVEVGDEVVLLPTCRGGIVVEKFEQGNEEITIINITINDIAAIIS